MASPKPKFDPSAPFQVVAKPPFDPSQPFDVSDNVSSNVKPDVSVLESGLRGAAQGASLGFADELSGGAEAALDKIKGSSESLGDLYRKHRDESRAKYEAAQLAHPFAYGTGELGGGAATAFVPGLGASNEANVASKIVRAALMGGAFGLGNSTADVTKGDVGGATLDAAKGASIGGGLGVATEAALPILSNLGDTAGAGADTLAAMHLRPTAVTRMRLGPEGIEGAAREALDSGAIRFGGRVADTADRLGNLRQEAGALKGDLISQSTGTVDPALVSARIHDEVVEPLRSTSAGTPTADRLSGELDRFATKYGSTPMSLEQSEAEKVAQNRLVNYNTEGRPFNDGMKGIARVLKEEGENAASDPTFDAVKTSYGNLSEAEKMARRTSALQNGGLLSHITDTGFGATALAGLASGTPAPALAYGARLLTKGRLASSGAVTLDTISSLLQSAPQALGQFRAPLEAAAQRGASSLAAAHYVLSNSSPQYRDTLKKATGEE